MKNFSLSAFCIGLGFGMIFSYFFIISNITRSDPIAEIENIPNEIVIQRAKEIGLIDPYEGVYKNSMEE
ncbi:MAG TPA: hypothetical protein VFD89_05145 [Clostridia bacterium]|nr:hypothetical protein [Clostridia bacterium]